MATIYTDPFMTLRIYKELANQPTVDWSNEYHFSIPSSLTGEARYTKLVEIANQFFRFERGFHLNTVRFSRAVWSTQSPEPPGTTPENHLSISFPTNNIGLRTIAASYTMVDLDGVIFCGKEVQAGSEGKLFYRGVMDTSMIEGNAPEKLTLDFDSATTQALVTAFGGVRNTEIQKYFYPLDPAADGVYTGMFYQPATGPLIFRFINLIYIKGATRNKRNKKFFNTGTGA